MRDLSWSSHRHSINDRDSGVMSSWVKTLVVLALVVPMTAYVAGSLVASSSYEPRDRRPVIIQDAPSQEPERVRDTTGTTTTAPSSRPAPTRSPTGPGTRRSTGQPSPSGTVDDDDATVVLPPPTSVDDDEDDDGDDDDDGPEEDDEDDGDDDGDDD
jgi:hypothetical protein